jgi:hypothetical protein
MSIIPVKYITIQYKYNFTRLSTGSRPEAILIEKDFYYKDITDLAEQAAAEGEKLVKEIHGENPTERATVNFLLFKP